MTTEMITSFLVKNIFNILPKWLARLFISTHKIARQIEIDLRRSNPIDISFGSEIPRLSLYFRISNLSPFNLVLDRLIIDLWIGQPTLNGAILVQYDVPKRSSIENVYFTNQLTLPQQDQIRKKINGQVLSEPVLIQIKAYFNSKVGVVYIEKRIEHRDILCR